MALMEYRSEKCYMIYILLVASILSAILIFLFLFSVKLKSESLSFGYNSLVISNFDHVTNKTSIGFIRIRKSLSKEEYLSIGENSLYSKFEAENFRCYGTCRCLSQNRRYANIIYVPLFFIVSSFSLSMAINIAKKYFNVQCNYSLTDCEESFIEANVNYCEKEEERNVKESFREYLCDGYCIENIQLTGCCLSRDDTRTALSNANCGKYRMEKLVRIEVTGEDLSVSENDDFVSSWLDQKAADKFFQSFTPFCRTSSIFKFDDGMGKQIISLCSSKNSRTSFDNLNVKCLLIRKG